MTTARAAIQRTWPWVVVSLAFVVIGGVLVRGSAAWAATTWMFIYSPADFATTQQLVTFLKELRAPIPPVIAATEIVSFRLTGTTQLVTNYLYKVSLVGAYLLALWS